MLVVSVTSMESFPDIEIGPNAKIKGQLHYREGLSILRGAKVSGALNPLEASPKAETLSPALVVG